jgi:HEPN domain-containing protein
MIAEHERSYIVWQNRAFRFYVPARLLYRRSHYSAAVFCASQAIELLLKATLVYWDRSFHPEAVRHRIARLIATTRNKVRGARSFDLPAYFFAEHRYYRTARYPTGSHGIAVPQSFLPDLDRVFAQLITLVPFQFNSELARALGRKQSATLLDLRRNNAQMKILRAHIRPRRRSGV